MSSNYQKKTSRKKLGARIVVGLFVLALVLSTVGSALISFFTGF